MSLDMTCTESKPSDLSSPSSPVDVSLTDPAMDLYEGGYNDPVYQAKARILNRALQDIGMGRYQWYLFIVTGFGWIADIAWPTLNGLILTPVVNEFNISGPLLLLASGVGLIVGSVFWGLGCDIMGRRFPFHATLFMIGIFGLASGGAPSFVALSSLTSMVGFGVAGLVPVDSAIFLDFMPRSHQYLVTTISIWWSIGQLLPSLVSWSLIANYSCVTAVGCTRSNNMGWRYVLFTMGGFTLFLWAIRIICFTLLESPRFLSGIGRDADAVDIIHRLAKFNGKTSSLTVEELEAPGRLEGHPSGKEKRQILSKSSDYNVSHIKALFTTTPKMAWSTSLLVVIWGSLGLAATLYHNFLPYLLASRGAEFGDASLYITYRNQVILSVVCVPAGLVAGRAVDVPYIGRKGTVAIASLLAGAMLLASTTARTSNNLLAWNSGYIFFNNIMYGALNSMSAEVFPARDRGTGMGLLITSTRVFGVLGPIIALYANLQTSLPVYISGALILLVGFIAPMLPYEPRGKASI